MFVLFNMISDVFFCVCQMTQKYAYEWLNSVYLTLCDWIYVCDWISCVMHMELNCVHFDPSTHPIIGKLKEYNEKLKRIVWLHTGCINIPIFKHFTEIAQYKAELNNIYWHITKTCYKIIVYSPLKHHRFKKIYLWNMIALM